MRIYTAYKILRISKSWGRRPGRADHRSHLYNCADTFASAANLLAFVNNQWFNIDNGSPMRWAGRRRVGSAGWRGRYGKGEARQGKGARPEHNRAARWRGAPGLALGRRGGSKQVTAEQKPQRMAGREIPIQIPVEIPVALLLLKVTEDCSGGKVSSAATRPQTTGYLNETFLSLSLALLCHRTRVPQAHDTTFSLVH